MSELKEKCAVFGVFGKELDVARLAFFGLYALQHRGQEATGISVTDGQRILSKKGPGLVSQVYGEDSIHTLTGHIAIGHNRYSTSRTNIAAVEHIQPYVCKSQRLVLAHNGNLPCTKKLEAFLEDKGIETKDHNDSKLMHLAIEYYMDEELTVVDAVKEAYTLFTGAFSLLIMTHDTLIAVRDKCGMRPLSIGRINGGGWAFASETCALKTVGIGTKGIVIDAAKMHHTAAYDLLAMVSSDITRYGGLPLVLTNILDVVSVGEWGDEVSETYKGLIEGLGNAVKEINAVVLKGETAQMSVCLGSEIADSPTKINWGASMIGAYHKDKMVTGETVAEGQVIIALKENGFRCNGISSLRKALAMKYGEEWWANPDGQEDIKKAAEPSVLYDLFINTLHGWYADDFKAEIPLHAIIHLSGGALREKLAKDLLFPRGLSAELPDLWDPVDIMRKCAEWRGISDEEFYETWNGGQGILLIIDEKDVDHCLKRAEDFGIQAKVAGRIVGLEDPSVRIVSKLSGETIQYKK